MPVMIFAALALITATPVAVVPLASCGAENVTTVLPAKKFEPPAVIVTLAT